MRHRIRERATALVGKFVLVRWRDSVNARGFVPTAEAIERELRAYTMQINMGKLVELARNDLTLVHHWSDHDPLGAGGSLIPLGCVESIAELEQRK